MFITATHHGDMSFHGTDSGIVLRDAFIKDYLQHRPRPKWVIVDSQTSLCKGEFVEFCHSIGIGVLVTPGEAHW